MKSIRLSIAAAIATAMALLSVPAGAQAPQRGPGPQGFPQGMMNQEQLPVKEAAVKRADMMNKFLELDKKQYKKVVNWCKAEIRYQRQASEERGRMWMMSMTDEDKEFQMSQDLRLKKILTPEQYKKWKDMTDRFKRGAGRRRGHGPGHGPGEGHGPQNRDVNPQ